MDEIKALVQSNQKILAIKRYREKTGEGLKEAHAYVSSLSNELESSSSDFITPQKNTSALNLSEKDKQHVIGLINQGDKDAAVNYLKEWQGMDAQESERTIHMLTMSIKNPTTTQQEKKKSSSALVVTVALFIAVAALIYYNI